MKILIAHELGTGRDGLIRISAMAQYLKEAFIGCSVVLAMKRPPDSKFMCNKYIDKIINNPSNNGVENFSSPLQFLTESYLSGSQELNVLKGKWRDIIKSEKPSLIIADNSPSALLVSYEFTIPCINVSTGIFSNYQAPTTAEFENSNNGFSGSDSCPNLIGDIFNSKATESIVIGLPDQMKDQTKNTSYAFIEMDKDDDGGLNLDIFAYIKRNDLLKDEIIMALDYINANLAKRIMVVMPGIEPLLYKPDFEVTPHFARLPGALLNSPLVIHSFGAGLSVDSIRFGCPMWGMPSSADQRYNRKTLGKQFSGVTSPKSKSDVLPSIIEAINRSSTVNEEARRLWTQSIKGGMLPLAACLTEKVQRLSL